MREFDKIENNPRVIDIIKFALQEDGANNDVTSLSLVNPAITVTASILARHKCRVAGCSVGEKIFHQVDNSLKVDVVVKDGDDINADDVLLRVRGSALSILSAERTVLNFMQRMTGIATSTKMFVDAVAGTKCKILDTRKTSPGLRVLDKYSVKAGGGTNHRHGLHDMVLIKDNHRKLWSRENSSRLDLAVLEARKKFPSLPIEVEVETLEELQNALSANPDWIMLDNMSPEKMKEAVSITAGRCKLEASGGINIDTIHAVAKSGVDAISLGCLTHSVKAADLSLEIDMIG